MPHTLTRGSTTLTPLALSEYTSDQDGGSIFHDIPGRADPDVTLRPAGLRSGMFTLTFAGESESNAARVALAAIGVWQLQSTERSSINMRFVVTRISRPIITSGHWGVTVTYREVGT